MESYSRRAFCARLIAMAGASPLGLHLLQIGSSAAPLVSPRGSPGADVLSTHVTFPGDGATLHGYLSRPNSDGLFPAVVLIHGGGGWNDGLRAEARALASKGYVTLAPDLLSRKGGSGFFVFPEDAAEIFESLDEHDIARDLAAARKYLASHAAVRKDRTGVREVGAAGSDRNVPM